LGLVRAIETETPGRILQRKCRLGTHFGGEARWQTVCSITSEESQAKDVRNMKAISSSDKSKNGSILRLEKGRIYYGELFLGYKALHELRILMRIASSRNHPGAKEDEKPSF
jgi:hypothetical protein